MDAHRNLRQKRFKLNSNKTTRSLTQLKFNVLCSSVSHFCNAPLKILYKRLHLWPETSLQELNHWLISVLSWILAVFSFRYVSPHFSKKMQCSSFLNHHPLQIRDLQRHPAAVFQISPLLHNKKSVPGWRSRCIQGKMGERKNSHDLRPEGEGGRGEMLNLRGSACQDNILGSLSPSSVSSVYITMTSSPLCGADGACMGGYALSHRSACELLIAVLMTDGNSCAFPFQIKRPNVEDVVASGGNELNEDPYFYHV